MVDKNSRVYIRNWFNNTQKFRKGDIIFFDLPCMFSDYEAKIYFDINNEPYINEKSNFINDCDKFFIKPKNS